VGTFCCSDLITDSERFYSTVLETLCCPTDVDEVKNLLAWWNRFVLLSFVYLILIICIVAKYLLSLLPVHARSMQEAPWLPLRQNIQTMLLGLHLHQLTKGQIFFWYQTSQAILYLPSQLLIMPTFSITYHAIFISFYFLCVHSLDYLL
jgi:hypothetical protein